MTARLKEKYKSDILPTLKSALGFKNPMRVPKVAKVVVNVGWKATTDKDTMKAVVEGLTQITGQKPIVTSARLSIANFKLREEMPIGAKVTLRGVRMYEFLDRLINVALPRIRDFRGISATAFDQHGNYTLGVKEQTIFPELDPDRTKFVHGMDITIVTTAHDTAESKELLKLMGMPFESA